MAGGRVNRAEGFIIAAAIVRRQVNLHQQRLGVGRFDIFNNGAQRLLGLLRRKTAQSVIAAELNQHPARLVLLKQRWQASQPLLRGIAADAGVHHRRFRLPLLIEQRRPCGVGRHPIASAQAVAEDQQRVRRHRAAGKQEQQQERHMPAENILEVHHLKKSVGQGEHQLSILTGVELVVKPRQTIALIGESGSGKSTLLAILAGLDDGSSGEVSMLGKPLHRMDEEARAALRAQHVGFVFQSFMLIPTLNALGERRAAGAVARRQR